MKEHGAHSFTVELATDIAREAHLGQKDRAGKEYINHPLTLMQRVRGDNAKMTAVLHDVVEDSQVTFEDLRQKGCPEEVIVALKLVTHPADYTGSEEEYFSMITLIAESGNQLAIDVKYVDLEHNSDITRIKNPKEKDLRRWEKYRKSMDILRPLVSPYLLESEM